MFCWWEGRWVGSLTTRSYIFCVLGLSLGEITLRSTFDREVEQGEKKKEKEGTTDRRSVCVCSCLFVAVGRFSDLGLRG